MPFLFRIIPGISHIGEQLLKLLVKCRAYSCLVKLGPWGKPKPLPASFDAETGGKASPSLLRGGDFKRWLYLQPFNWFFSNEPR